MILDELGQFLGRFFPFVRTLLGIHDNVRAQFSVRVQDHQPERFVGGVSEGVRTKWYPSGVKLSEAAIVRGKLNGTFRRWHENGRLAEQIELRDDQPDGLSLACYPSGCLKARVRLELGKVIGREDFKDGEVPGPPAMASVGSTKPKS